MHFKALFFVLHNIANIDQEIFVMTQCDFILQLSRRYFRQPVRHHVLGQFESSLGTINR